MATPTTLPSSFSSGAVLTAAQMNNLRGAFRVFQVVSAAKTDTFSTASTSFVDVTGLSVSVTPSATSSKILVFMDVKVGGANLVDFPGLRLVRDSTAIYVGDAASSRIQATFGGNVLGDMMPSAVGIFLDSPSTTSATTYKVQMRVASDTGYVNRSDTDTNSASYYRAASSITVMEISA